MLSQALRQVVAKNRLTALPIRGMKLHEYQAGALLHSYKISIPIGNVARTADEAFSVANNFKSSGYVVKSQVLGGGRGLGHFKETGFQGGVHLVDTPDKVKTVAKEMLGNTLVTKQSGAEGLPCGCVYIVEKIGIARELYLSLTLDRAGASPTFIYSQEGGIAIEDVAHETPKKIFKLAVNPLKGLEVADLKQAAVNLGLQEQEDQVISLFQKLYQCFNEKDCDMIEINPLVLTKQGVVMAADSKVTIDSNALYRQMELAKQEDKTQDNVKEAEAKEFDLNYIHIGGNIGCLVNGAGLAMSTMDIINMYGGAPANFLDVGGSAEGEALVFAMKLMNDDPEVKAIFVNIFGGILRCDRLAESIIAANEKHKFTKPIVLRLKGTNSDIAKEMIAGREKELNIYYNEDFDSAAQLVCKVAVEQTQ